MTTAVSGATTAAGKGRRTTLKSCREEIGNAKHDKIRFYNRKERHWRTEKNESDQASP
jgi:ribosomal protein S30